MKIVIGPPRNALFDRAGRTFGDLLQKALGSEISYENLDDDSGEKAAAFVARAPADGESLLLGNKGAMTAHPQVAPSEYRLTDFTPIGLIAEAPIGIAVGNRSRFRTARELFAAAREKPETVSFSTPHPFHTQRLAIAAFAKRNNLKLKFIVLPGGNAAALQRVADGSIDFALLAAHNYVAPLKAGDIRVIGIAAPKRVPFLPDVPTLTEQGFDLVTAIWLGLFYRAGVPSEFVARARGAMTQAFAAPDARDAMEKLNIVPAFEDHAQFEQRIRADFEMHRGVLKELNALPR
jgi:tripartite-type tricarboxylate transporter receptor subunit TctC